MDGTRRYDEIGDERPHSTRRGKHGVLTVSCDPEAAEQTQRDSARPSAEFLRIMRRSSVPGRFHASCHAGFTLTPTRYRDLVNLTKMVSPKFGN